MHEFPSGTVTLLFTDIEGSTRLLESLRSRYEDLLADHHRLLREAWSANGGVEVGTEGDAFFVVFSRADDAVAAAAQAQRSLVAHPWPEGASVRVRIGIHTGSPTLAGEGYVGIDVHRAARISSAAHGGQVLVSETTRQLVDEQGLEGLSLRDLGQHRLKDLSQPQRLYQLVLGDLSSDFPPPRTLENRPTNLPAQPTPFLGRERELREVIGLLRRDPVRVLTLIGPGGTGKTRLALQAAAELIEEYAQGVFLVTLAAITDSELVLPTVAQTLGVREQPGEPLVESVKNDLREKQLLLVLDNFEQVDDAAPVLGELIASAPGLKAMVTSRAPLHLAAEHEYPVSPLEQEQAVQLFLERAQAVQPGFALDGNRPVVEEICRRLDHLPLAVELAAARVKLLPPASLLARLEQRLKLLTGGPRDLPSRQQTLRGAIDWSYELLDPAEQRLFARLSVFLGGRTLEAIEAVCDPEGELGMDVLDGLASLVDKSLLRQEETEGEPRLVMLETIHEYARERLEASGEAEELRGRHARYFLALVETEQERAGARVSADALDRLEPDFDNTRSAIDWLVASGSSTLALRFAHRVTPFWGLRLTITELRRRMESVLASCRPDDEGLADHAWLLGSVAGYAHQQDGSDAQELAREALDAAERLGDRAMVARSLNILALVTRSRGELDEAERLFVRAVGIDEECDDERALGGTIMNLGDLELYRGNYSRALELFERARELSASEPLDLAQCLGNIAVAQIHLDQHLAAGAVLREGATLCRRLGWMEGIAYFVGALGVVAVNRGKASRGTRLLSASETIRAEIGIRLERFERRMYDEAIESARRDLGERGYDAAWHEGSLLSAEEALDVALSAPGSTIE